MMPAAINPIPANTMAGQRMSSAVMGIAFLVAYVGAVIVVAVALQQSGHMGRSYLMCGENSTCNR